LKRKHLSQDITLLNRLGWRNENNAHVKVVGSSDYSFMEALTGLQIKGYWQDKKKTKRSEVSKLNIHKVL
jgi:hypothetical protein